MIKPDGYWTKERCIEEALKYDSRTDFKNKSSACYSISTRNGWHNEICQHMTYKQLPNGYWTKEKCQEEALKYKTRGEFQKKSKSAYSVTHINGWLDEICQHMTYKQLPNGYWTKERCIEEALKYEMRNDFRINSKSAYLMTYKNGWLDEICQHMHREALLSDYWTKEKCHEEALKYKTKKEFKENCRQVYAISCNNKWIDEISTHMFLLKKPISYWTEEMCKAEALKYQYKTDYIIHSQKAYNIAQKNDWNKKHCNHMIILGDKYNRLIYVYEFLDNYAYVGLTFNIKKRNAKHLSLNEIKLTSVAKHMSETNLTPTLIKLTDYLPVKVAQNLEDFYIEKYKKGGWLLLNKLKGGGLGSTRKIIRK